MLNIVNENWEKLLETNEKRYHPFEGMYCMCCNLNIEDCPHDQMRIFLFEAGRYDPKDFLKDYLKSAR